MHWNAQWTPPGIPGIESRDYTLGNSRELSYLVLRNDLAWSPRYNPCSGTFFTSDKLSMQRVYMFVFGMFCDIFQYSEYFSAYYAVFFMIFEQVVPQTCSVAFQKIKNCKYLQFIVWMFTGPIWLCTTTQLTTLFYLHFSSFKFTLIFYLILIYLTILDVCLVLLTTGNFASVVLWYLLCNHFAHLPSPSHNGQPKDRLPVATPSFTTEDLEVAAKDHLSMVFRTNQSGNPKNGAEDEDQISGKWHHKNEGDNCV